MKMDNKVYDILKYVCQIGLPALGTCYFGLAQIIGLPYGEEVVGCVAVITACLGTLLGISARQYKKGLE